MDIDIDTPSSFNPLNIFPNWVRASNIIGGELRAHPCGVYAQQIARDPITKLAAIPYADAEEMGYIKLDFLHNHIYDYFESKEEIDALIDIEPEWDLLLIPSIQSKLFQLSKHGEVLDIIKPRSIDELADVLALIRPGKREFLSLYLKNKNECRKILYGKDRKGGYSFKRSHAIAYALVIVLQLHLFNSGSL